jgi:hypothetical protein
MALRRGLGALTLLVASGCGSSDPVRHQAEEGGDTSVAGADDGGNGGAPTSSDTPRAGEGGEPLGGAAPTATACPTPTGAPIEHSTRIEADETWAAGLHDVTFDILVHNDATLTIEPCAVVRVIPTRGFQVNGGGKIVAHGSADQPIVFQGQDHAAWGSILVDSTGYVDLAYVTVQDAGELGATRGSAGGALHLAGVFDQPLQRLAKVDHVTLEGAVRFGAVLEMRGAFTDDSDSLTITGSGEMAMWASASSLGSIPPGDYSGNMVDAIRIKTDTNVDADVTIHERGVPYVVGGDGASSQLRVHGLDDKLAVLTIEPGVTLEFPKSDRDSALYLQHSSNAPVDAPSGALVAVGTAKKPIVFTSAEATPAAGDWIGVWFDAFSAQDELDYVRVEYAGGDTGTDSFSCGTPQAPNKSTNRAAIAIFAEPTGEFVKHTTIAGSAWNAFDRAWTNGTAVDFRPTNTFSNIQYCAQTYPRQEGPSATCPAMCDAP